MHIQTCVFVTSHLCFIDHRFTRSLWSLPYLSIPSLPFSPYCPAVTRAWERERDGDNNTIATTRHTDVSCVIIKTVWAELIVHTTHDASVRRAVLLPPSLSQSRIRRPSTSDAIRVPPALLSAHPRVHFLKIKSTEQVGCSCMLSMASFFEYCMVSTHTHTHARARTHINTERVRDWRAFQYLLFEVHRNG